MALTTVLLDLDGVIRFFDPDRRAAIEARYQLAPGALSTEAFEPELLAALVTGRSTRAAWVEEVGRRTAAPAAAAEWLSHLGTVDQAILAEVAALRADGVVVAVLTNGSDTIPDEMRRLDLHDRFDAIYSSAAIGYAKPDRRVFEHVCHQLGVVPGSVFFTDDTEGHLGGAAEIGMTARLYQGVDTFREHLVALGFRPG